MTYKIKAALVALAIAVGLAVAPAAPALAAQATPPASCTTVVHFSTNNVVNAGGGVYWTYTSWMPQHYDTCTGVYLGYVSFHWTGTIVNCPTNYARIRAKMLDPSGGVATFIETCVPTGTSVYTQVGTKACIPCSTGYWWQFQALGAAPAGTTFDGNMKD